MDGLVIRRAQRADVPALVALFADDAVGGHGDTTDPEALPAYLAAFEVIAGSPRERLYVAELDGAIAGTFQTVLSTILTGRGSTGMIIEAVQTRGDLRGRGIGAAMIRFCIEEARRLGCDHVRLTSNRARTGAHRFYERLGFAPSHLGFKLKL